jgi:DNA invertase Pin-like site-specific DNA recombinase
VRTANQILNPESRVRSNVKHAFGEVGNMSYICVMENNKSHYVAYYRVSTAQQGKSGLGLAAQETDVLKYTNGHIHTSFTDIESGKNDKRPELSKAIEYCKTHDYTLVVAKLDRLSRNVVFISQLMESKIRFVCCDMPEANEFTIHIFAALAQQERKMISKRTKDALQAAKARGVKLGNPQADKAFMDRIRSNRKPKEKDRTIMFIINKLREEGKSYDNIAAELNAQEFTTFHGKPFRGTTVLRLFNAVKHVSNV